MHPITTLRPWSYPNIDTRPTITHIPAGLVKTQAQSSHPLIPSPPTQSRTKHIHISHTTPTPLIPRTTLILSTPTALIQDLNHVYHLHAIHSPQSHLLHPTPQAFAVSLTSSHPQHSLTIHTSNSNNSTRIIVTVKNCIHIGYHDNDNSTDRPKTNT